MTDCNSNFIFSYIIKKLIKKNKISYDKTYIINNCTYIIKKSKKK